MTKPADHWAAHARQWDFIGSPLRPCRQDIAFFEQTVQRWQEVNSTRIRPNALIMGVTPEVALMDWPADTRILAIDHNIGMINYVWPTDLQNRHLAVCGKWESPPLTPGSIDIAIGDGCFTQLDYADAYTLIARNLHEVLAPGGVIILRFFVRPAEHETIPKILADLQAGHLQSFDAFRLRLAMALHDGATEKGVCLGDVWEAWNTLDLDKDALADHPGWSKEVLAIIDNYRGKATRYSLPTIPELIKIFDQFFIETGRFCGNYEMGERCPSLVFQHKPS